MEPIFHHRFIVPLLVITKNQLLFQREFGPWFHEIGTKEFVPIFRKENVLFFLNYEKFQQGHLHQSLILIP